MITVVVTIVNIINVTTTVILAGGNFGKLGELSPKSFYCDILRRNMYVAAKIKFVKTYHFSKENGKRCPMGGIDSCILLLNELLTK